jgi:hypothetical protein
MLEDDRPPDSIDPDSIPGRLTLIEERLKAMSIGHDSLRTTTRRRHRSTTKRSNSVDILGLAVAGMFVVALFLLYAELAPSPNAGWAPSPTVVPPAAPSAGPSNAPEPDSHF